MISGKKLIRIARKWQKIAAVRRKRIAFPRINSHRNVNCSSSQVNAGNFVIYTTDDTRFVFPLTYLSSNIFRELFRMSEEVFGLPSEGPIKFPCDSSLMELIISLMNKGLAKDVERVLLSSIETSCSSLSVAFHQQFTGQQVLVSGY